MDATVKLPSSSNSRKSLFMARAADVLTGVSCGLYLTAWLHRALGLTGSSVSRLALQFVVLASLVLAFAIARRLGRLVCLTDVAGQKKIDGASFLTAAIIHLVLVVFAAFPGLMTGPVAVVSEAMVTDAMIGSAVYQWLVAALAIASGWLVPLVLTVVLMQVRSTTTGTGNVYASRLAAVSLGIVFAVFVPGLIGGSTAIALLGTLCGCTALGLAAASQLITTTGVDEVVPSMSEGSIENPLRDTRRSWQAAVAPLAVAVACGFLFAVLRRMLDQLFLDTAWLSSIEWAGVLAGGALGCCLAFRRATFADQIPLLAAAWSILLLAAFPVWIGLTLELKATVSIALVSMSLKSAAAACVVAPLGCGLGVLAARTQSDHWQWQIPLTFCAGIGVAEWLAIPRLGVVTAATIAVGLVAVVRVAELFLASNIQTQSPPSSVLKRRRAVLGATTCLVLCLGSLWAHRAYDPALSAELLFDTRVFNASRSSLRFELLSQLSEERCLTVVETPGRTLTLWRKRGSQVHLRECGVPVGVIGCEPDLGPQLSAESLQAILPLAFHERPARILLTGMGSGAVLQTSLHFPLTRIDCIEPDRTLLSTVSDNLLSRITPSPLDDDRVRVHCCDPVLALRAMPAEYDVILCRPSQPVLSRAAAETTAEYLQSVAGCLSESGLCAQPLDIVDLGPAAVRSFVQTWQSVFTDVAAIEIAPGRLLLMGSDCDRGIFRKGFIDRLQHPHVRFALSQTGWDWSTPLQLAAWSPDALNKLYEGQHAAVSRISNMTLTCWLPWEVARWGDKYTQVSRQLTTQSVSLQLMAGPDDGQSADVQDRLAELREQTDLIRYEPDQYWAYRKVTKRLLTESPRSELVQVKGEEPVHKRHREDKQRLQYFRALGTAAKNTTAENLLAVAALEQPYDPLVTFFMHQEIAELASRDRDQFSDMELQHRLHRAHYTSPGDHSVRNVIAAIELLCLDSAAEYDPVWRGDHLDALMQILQDRWANRGDIKPDSSRVMLIDIKESIAAMEQAFDVMPALCESRGISTQDWADRELVLEKLLVRPLRTYRTMLLPHHERDQRRNAQD